ncbi:MAG TPA: DMT family transporter [Rhodocyclaceae bacterium]|nr:DMT family transporter [Rhodocyclaceae bacterium]
MSEPAHHPLRAIALFLMAMLLFATLDTTAKHLAQTFPVPMLVWARYTFHFLLMLLVLGWSMRGRLIATRHPVEQVLRALLLVATTGFGVAALRIMPLAESTAIFFVAPLIVTVLAVPLLGEAVGGRRYVAVLAGFAGVLLIARPGGTLPAAGVAAALVAAVAYSGYQILTRRIARHENAVTMVFYTALVGTAVMTLALPWYWSGPMPDWRQALLICSLGIYGGTGHFLLTRAFRLAPASTLSPFQYVQLVWATLLGWLVFGQLPDGLSMAGGLVIAASGVAIALDERRSGASGGRPGRPS